MNTSAITNGPYIPWKLAPDSDPKERFIVTTEDGETEICGPIDNPLDAPLLAASWELLKALKEFMDIWGSRDSNGDSKRAQKRRAALWDMATQAVAKAEGRKYLLR